MSNIRLIFHEQVKTNGISAEARDIVVNTLWKRVQAPGFTMRSHPDADEVEMLEQHGYKGELKTHDDFEWWEYNIYGPEVPPLVKTLWDKHILPGWHKDQNGVGEKSNFYFTAVGLVQTIGAAYGIRIQ